MTCLLLISQVICYSVYWCFEGIREAYYYDRLPREPIYSDNKLLFKSHKNIKFEFVMQRMSFVITNVILGLSLTQNFLYPIGLLLIQPFFHLGYYYQTRNKLNPSIYYNRFFSTASNSSTALTDIYSKPLIKKIFSEKMYKKLTKTPFIRVLLFSLGFSIIFLSILYTQLK